MIIIADSNVTALEAFFSHGYNTAQAYDPFLTYLSTNHPSSGQFVGNGETSLTANQNVFFVAATGSRFDCTCSLDPTTTTAPPCPSSEYICPSYDAEFPCQSGAVASGLSASETVLTANIGFSYCYLARTVPVGQMASVSCTYVGTDVNTPVIIIADSDVTALEAFFPSGYDSAQAYGPFLTYLNTNHPSSGQFVGNGTTTLTANQNVFFVAATGSGFDCTYSLGPATTTTTASWQPLTRNSTITTLSTAATMGVTDGGTTARLRRTVRTSCAGNAFVDRNTVLTQIACDRDCVSCVDQQTCKECVQGAGLLYGRCFSPCPTNSPTTNGFFLNGSLCGGKLFCIASEFVAAKLHLHIHRVEVGGASCKIHVYRSSGSLISYI